MGEAAPALVIEDLHKSFGELEVLKGVSMTAQDGDVIAMIGSSGSGKSTLLRCINLLETPDSGRVFVNGELIRLYWQIGGLLDARQAQEGWGAGVIPRLARDIRNELPEVKGFSERNIDRMLAFARAYPRPVEFSPQRVAKLPAPPKAPQAVAKTAAEADSLLWQIPWGHHALMLEKLATTELRRWYMAQTVAQGWSRSTLALQISAQAHARRCAGN